jgi:glucokinase
MSLTIGVDVGGTKVLGGIVDSDGKILATIRRPTPASDGAATRQVIIEIVRELTAGNDVAAVGIGTPGWVDPTRSTVLFAANLAWRDEPLLEHVRAAVDLPVVVENDANAATWAEFRYGAARDAGDSVVMLTVGTGIGGGIVVDGRLFRGAHGMAAEPGHIIAVPGGHRCGCGRRGCLDQYASGRALIRFAHDGAASSPSSLSGDTELTGAMVTDAARAGDAVALEAFLQVARWLGQGVADLVQLLDPQVVVIGGGVIETGDLLMTPLQAAYTETLARRGTWPCPEVRPAEKGDVAGLIGAADLARVPDRR